MEKKNGNKKGKTGVKYNSGKEKKQTAVKPQIMIKKTRSFFTKARYEKFIFLVLFFFEKLNHWEIASVMVFMMFKAMIIY